CRPPSVAEVGVLFYHERSIKPFQVYYTLRSCLLAGGRAEEPVMNATEEIENLRRTCDELRANLSESEARRISLTEQLNVQRKEITDLKLRADQLTSQRNLAGGAALVGVGIGLLSVLGNDE